MSVVILDFGSQTTQLIARRVREAHVFSEVLPCTVSKAEVLARSPQAIILSGGPASVDESSAPKFDASILDIDVPVLGICYGHQLLAKVHGGRVERADHREFGSAELKIENPVGILKRFDAGEATEVWMSHGDAVTQLPEGFVVLASSKSSPNCVVANLTKRHFGIQFHPEVVHSKRGKDVLEAFLFDVAGIAGDWTSASWVTQSIEDVRKRVPAPEHAICGLSGGVDSAVAAILCKEALGERLTCIFVDTGLLREGEREDVTRIFETRVKLVVVDAREEFLSALRGVSDPETKRKIIGRVFIDVFDREAAKVSQARFLVQGTLYPDVIESTSTKGPSAVIKSHHNVGGLPENMKLLLVEPLRQLFKDEVREGGRLLGLPDHLLGRHPFPGPGLAIRCLGEITEERLSVLRKADAIFTEELRASGLYEKIWQAFVALLPVRSVGVMGDQRTYEETCALRAVTSTDGMTADWYPLPHAFLAKVSNRITNEVRGINRVVYDISSKPPATIEWE